MSASVTRFEIIDGGSNANVGDFFYETETPGFNYA
jgi:hypothetical protein